MNDQGKRTQDLEDALLSGRGLAAERFVEAFVASLVTHGIRTIAPKEPATRRGLAAVVHLIDDWIESLRRRDIEWERIVPWVRIANSLRPSSLGGVENWERQLKAAQGHLTRVPNPDYKLVDLLMSPATARFELEKLSRDEQALIERAVEAFKQQHRAAA